MFCRNCGAQIDDNAVVCPHCGVLVDGQVNPVNPVPQPQPVAQKNTIALVGFIFSFFFALVGLICSIVGFNRVKNYTGSYDVSYKNLAIAGIVISAVNMALGFTISFLI